MNFDNEKERHSPRSPIKNKHNAVMVNITAAQSTAAENTFSGYLKDAFLVSPSTMINSSRTPTNRPSAFQGDETSLKTWTIEEDTRLLSTYHQLISDPLVTPFTGSVPPVGLSHRIARTFRNTFISNRSTRAIRQRLVSLCTTVNKDKCLATQGHISSLSAYTFTTPIPMHFSPAEISTPKQQSSKRKLDEPLQSSSRKRVLHFEQPTQASEPVTPIASFQQPDLLLFPGYEAGTRSVDTASYTIKSPPPANRFACFPSPVSFDQQQVQESSRQRPLPAISEAMTKMSMITANCCDIPSDVDYSYTGLGSPFSF